MTRDDDINKQVERWKSYIPPEQDISDVWKVVLYYFPESEIRKGSGSHLHYVVWPDHEILASRLGQTKIDPFDFNNKFCLPLVKGKRVKAAYVKELLKAIEWKERFDEIRSKKS